MRSFAFAWLVCSGLQACFPYESRLGREPGSCGCDDSAPESAAILDEAHPGWSFPGCWGCHDSATTHNPDLDPYECSACHGSNGAPAGHGGGTPCGGCHGEPHGADGFPDPQACQTCHPG